MIIQCDKCLTKFHLDDSRVTGAGIRVRCTKCQNVFIVTPPPVVEFPLEEITFGVKSPPAKDASASGHAKDPENLKFDFSREGSAGAPGSASVVREGEKADTADDKDRALPSFDDIDFGSHPLLSKEEGSLLFPPKTDAGAATEGPGGAAPETQHHDDHDISFDEVDFGFDDLEHKDETGHGEQTVHRDESSQTAVPAEPPVKDEWGIFTAGPKTEDKPAIRQETPIEEKPSEPLPPEVKVYPKASGYSSPGKEDFFNIGSPQKILDKETDSVEDVVEFTKVLNDAVEKGAGPPEGTELNESHVATGARSGAVGLIIAAVVLILGAAAVYYTGAVDTVARRIAPKHDSTAKKTIQIDAVTGYVAQNKNFGKLFVIQGSIKNLTDEPQEIKKVKGVLYNSSGESIAERLVTPGRIVSADDIKNLSKEELLKTFRDASKGTIPPKGTLPVMVLFTETPDGLAECGIDVIR